MSEQNDCEQKYDKTPGLISWSEVTTHDAKASGDFYTGLFGWTREDMDMDGCTYTVFKTGERSVAGMFPIPPERQDIPVIWMNYVTVENLEASLAKACELGATVCKEITTLQIGRFAIIKDPQGAAIGLWQFI